VSIYDFFKKIYYYRLQPKHLLVGSIIESGANAKPLNGHTLPLSKIPVGSFIHNISLIKGKPAKLSRSAGTYSILVEKSLTLAKIKLSSGEIKRVSNQCMATMGVLSNSEIKLTKLGKAGRSRWLNIRPTVRGVAMNPIDHPHGGGEGKTSGGRKSSVTPWGKSIPSRRKR
jgi:large subunit ribosomal protein L2